MKNVLCMEFIYNRAIQLVTSGQLVLGLKGPIDASPTTAWWGKHLGVMRADSGRAQRECIISIAHAAELGILRQRGGNTKVQII